jgi:hypothetical protein
VTHSDAEIQGAAMTLVDGLIRNATAEDWASADSFVALATDAETHAVTLHGSFRSAEAARIWAEQFEKELNAGMPAADEPFTVTVYPMLAPS